MPRNDEQLDPELHDLAARHGQHRKWFAKQQPRGMGQVVSELLAKRGYANQRENQQLATLWDEAVGPPLCRFSQAIAIRRGRLEVIVANNLQLQELSFDKERILAALKQLAPDLRITDLMLRIGRVKK